MYQHGAEATPSAVRDVENAPSRSQNSHRPRRMRADPHHPAPAGPHPSHPASRLHFALPVRIAQYNTVFLPQPHPGMQLPNRAKVLLPSPGALAQAPQCRPANHSAAAASAPTPNSHVETRPGASPWRGVSMQRSFFVIQKGSCGLRRGGGGPTVRELVAFVSLFLMLWSWRWRWCCCWRCAAV